MHLEPKVDVKQKSLSCMSNKFKHYECVWVYYTIPIFSCMLMDNAKHLMTSITCSDQSRKSTDK